MYFLYKYGFIVSSTYHMFNTYNRSIILFNLIPIIPLDGSKLIFSLFTKFLSFRISYILIIIVGVISLVLFICSFIIAAQLNTVENTDIIAEGMREAELLTELQKANNRYEELKKEYEKSQIIVDEYKTDASTNDL